MDPSVLNERNMFIIALLHIKLETYLFSQFEVKANPDMVVPDNAVRGTSNSRRLQNLI